MHVGMNRIYGIKKMIVTRVPHARGDEPQLEGQTCRRHVSSPCTWG